MQERRSYDIRGQKPDKFLINEQITFAEVRVIGSDGEQIGILPIKEALLRAQEEGVDLVAVAPDAKPPVCRLLDYGKLKYREQKKAAEARKRTAVHTVKEIRLRYSTEVHDLQTKLRNARKFLDAGDKVRFQIQFKGREVVYKELGQQRLDEVAEELSDVSVVEDLSPLLGKRMHMVLAPKAK